MLWPDRHVSGKITHRLSVLSIFDPNPDTELPRATWGNAAREAGKGSANRVALPALGWVDRYRWLAKGRAAGGMTAGRGRRVLTSAKPAATSVACMIHAESRERIAIGIKSAVKRTPRPQLNDGYGADTGPSGGDPFRPVVRPFEASKASVCYVRNTSTPVVRSAQIPIIPHAWRTVKSTQSGLSAAFRWTWLATSTIIAVPNIGSDHGRRGLAAEPRSRAVRSAIP
jgi:hypothetical protein